MRHIPQHRFNILVKAALKPTALTSLEIDLVIVDDYGSLHAISRGLNGRQDRHKERAAIASTEFCNKLIPQLRESDVSGTAGVTQRNSIPRHDDRHYPFALRVF